MFTNMGITAEMIGALITEDDAAKPRSQQTAVGPSQLGVACPRQLGYAILGTPKVSGGGDPLPRWLGTEGHTGLDRILTGNPDWSTEHRIELPGYGIAGHVDAYHHPSNTVVDWKFVGQASMRTYKANGPSQQYRWQAHLYGLGMAMQGHPVANVAIVFIPRSGFTSSIHVWTEPYDETIPEAALQRYEAIKLLAETDGPATLPTAPGPCDWCNWHDPQNPDPDRACSGHITQQQGARA